MAADGSGWVYLCTARDQLEAILRGVADAVTAQGPDGRLLFANVAAVELLGYESGEALLSAPREEIMSRFEALLDACEAYAAESGLGRLVAGVDTGRLDAYRRLIARGFGIERVGLSMRLRPEAPDFDTPAHYVIDDRR